MYRLIVFAALFLASVVLPRSVWAGVVMTEVSVVNGPSGRFAQNKTLYFEGNKQKVERPDIDAITDLDKNIIYIVDKHQRVYIELPLLPDESSRRDDSETDTIDLSRTGDTRIIANHSCTEYRAKGGNALEQVIISACVANGVPGARQMASFEHKMVSRLSGHEFSGSDKLDRDAIMLEKESVIRVRLPDSTGGRAFRVASLRTSTQVKSIQVRPLAADTFKPPKGYSRLKSQPEQNSPLSPLDVRGHAIEVIAPRLPRMVESLRG